MTHFINNAQWRYATKKFDNTKKISDKDLETIKEAIQLSASSYGLQPYKILIVENPELREKIQPAAWGQTQIVDASHLLIFANITNIGENEIDEYFDTISKTRNISIEDLTGYKDFMKSKILPLSEEEKNTWTSKQTYLALGNLLNIAAELKIDATPMEGFNPEEVNKILELDKQGLNASLIATIGYRHSDDYNQNLTKVRKPFNDLFKTI